MKPDTCLCHGLPAENCPVRDFKIDEVEIPIIVGKDPKARRIIPITVSGVSVHQGQPRGGLVNVPASGPMTAKSARDFAHAILYASSMAELAREKVQLEIDTK